MPDGDQLPDFLYRVSAAWLNRHGKDGPGQLVNVYRTDRGPLRWKKLPVPEYVWAQERPPVVLAAVAQALMGVPMAPPGTVHGVAFTNGAWGVAVPMTGAPGDVAKVDQVTAWAHEHKLYRHPDRTEAVVTNFVGMDGTQAMAMWTVDARTQGIEREAGQFIFATDEEISGDVPAALAAIVVAYRRAQQPR